MSSQKTVVVGMSGGVDSSVSALLLKEQGYNVIGMFMKNWEEVDENGVCPASRDFEDVVRVCDQISIPYYSVNFVKEYWENVFSHFIEELKLGHTPNPDILCNREIKFKVLLDKALQLGADFLATGHYCQNALSGSLAQLLKGRDPGKDQSYFLYAISQRALHKALFPIGGLLKSEVREIARRHRLSTSEKKDSTGICFIGKRDFKQFLGQYLSFQKGNFENVKGDVIGQHDGVAYYTIGQRKGLGIGGQGEAWFVVGKDVERNVVVIDQGPNHPALYANTLTATELHWHSPELPKAPFTCRAKIRYRQADQECVIEKVTEDRIEVRFSTPQRAITPRQSIVFYKEDVCLGGALIERAGPTLHELGLSVPSSSLPI
ncbi:tRNA 2-thiouridine(34) synthase MnmA [Parachlamydia sp. AcF125]|uniref:tRNA 2-thiouridine(34) synthase MnmA n=1 Tax=Parachlamydia sp. AcF125 TaxID=2795736 RepID=UPI001BC96CBF|nr:tRNA 2-thiouridine(34) synthase MnmA [Parachlamydia sp. AcF125]MBS4167725.1 tRNA-specific 2-thiouridylase MnmA [Parachlamydia sp. AcF125]